MLVLPCKPAGVLGPKHDERPADPYKRASFEQFAPMGSERVPSARRVARKHVARPAFCAPAVRNGRRFVLVLAAHAARQFGRFGDRHAFDLSW